MTYSNSYYVIVIVDIVPIVDTVVQHSAATHLPMGYGFLCGYLRELLEKDTQFKREYQGPVDDALVRFLMEEVCEVSPTPIEATDPSKGRKEKEIQRVTITFNGQQFTVGDARFKVYEALFVPPHSLGLKYTRSLTESMLYSTLAVDGDRRIQLLDNIVLAGHYCKIKGTLYAYHSRLMFINRSQTANGKGH